MTTKPRHLVALPPAEDMPSREELIRIGLGFELDRWIAAQILSHEILWNPLTDEMLGADVALPADRLEVPAAWERALTISPVAAAGQANGVQVMLCLEHVNITHTVGYSIMFGWSCTCPSWEVIGGDGLWCCRSVRAADHQVDCCPHVALVSELLRSETPYRVVDEAIDDITHGEIQGHHGNVGW